MKAIIEGLRFDTETAEKICSIGSNGGVSVRDFHWWDAVLYKTKKGRFFMAGCGNAASPFAERHGNGSSGGSGIRLLSDIEARRFAEKACEPEVIERFFAVEDG